MIVAPFAGAWIEIGVLLISLTVFIVAPFAGAWIEIREDEEGVPAARGRSLRGSVD